MSYAAWLVPSKTSGSGNDTVNVTAGSDNTGRSARQTNMTFKAPNCEDVVRTVTQAGKPSLLTAAALWIFTNSGLPAWVTVRTTSSQFGALNVILV